MTSFDKLIDDVEKEASRLADQELDQKVRCASVRCVSGDEMFSIAFATPSYSQEDRERYIGAKVEEAKRRLCNRLFRMAFYDEDAP